MNASIPSAIDENITVLLVEDETAVRKMAKDMLIYMGYSVFEAKDGVDAVDVFKEHQDEINIVISDLGMPRMDGWETLTALRQIKPGLPVILASGYDKEHVMAGDHLELPQNFLSKPFTRIALRDVIVETLSLLKT